MTLDKLRAGFVAVARTTFDVALADATAQAARAALREAGFEVIGVEHLITDHESLDAGARAIRRSARPADRFPGDLYR